MICLFQMPDETIHPNQETDVFDERPVSGMWLQIAYQWTWINCTFVTQSARIHCPMSQMFNSDVSILLVHQIFDILIWTSSQSDIQLQRYKQFFEVPNKEKHKNLSPVNLARNSKSILATSDTLPLIMSHQCLTSLVFLPPSRY